MKSKNRAFVPSVVDSQLEDRVALAAVVLTTATLNAALNNIRASYFFFGEHGLNFNALSVHLANSVRNIPNAVAGGLVATLNHEAQVNLRADLANHVPFPLYTSMFAAQTDVLEFVNAQGGGGNIIIVG
jgi:hypothetical protein